MIRLTKFRVTFALSLFYLFSFETRVYAKEKVAGIGGFFFRSENPKSLAKWYLDHLGIDLAPPESPAPWQQQAGPTVFEPFEKGSPMIPNTKTWMINFRVTNLEALVKQLTGAGIKVKVDPAPYPYGRFADLVDPEGNGIQLWEPK